MLSLTVEEPVPSAPVPPHTHTLLSIMVVITRLDTFFGWVNLLAHIICAPITVPESQTKEGHQASDLAIHMGPRHRTALLL